MIIESGYWSLLHCSEEYSGFQDFIILDCLPDAQEIASSECLSAPECEAHSITLVTE